MWIFKQYLRFLRWYNKHFKKKKQEPVQAPVVTFFYDNEDKLFMSEPNNVEIMPTPEPEIVTIDAISDELADLRRLRIIHHDLRNAFIKFNNFKATWSSDCRPILQVLDNLKSSKALHEDNITKLQESLDIQKKLCQDKFIINPNGALTDIKTEIFRQELYLNRALEFGGKTNLLIKAT